MKSWRKLRFEVCEQRCMLANFAVTNTHDGIVLDFDDQPGTLRQAIFDANNTLGPDIITFDSSLNGETITLGIDEFGNNLNLGASGELTITDSVEIRGLGADLLTVDASGNDSSPNSVTNDANTGDDGDGSRVFRIDAQPEGGVEISGLKLTGGDTDVFEGGAGILHLGGSLELFQVIIADNNTLGSGAGLYAEVDVGETHRWHCRRATADQELARPCKHIADSFAVAV